MGSDHESIPQSTPVENPSMNPLSRRSFLGASLAGLSATHLLGQDAPKATEAEKITEPIRKAIDDYAFNPSTLFLTWHADPTTTMDI